MQILSLEDEHEGVKIIRQYYNIPMKKVGKMAIIGHKTLLM
jgi:hypothetical protein